MSTYYYASAIIGVAIDLKVLEEKTAKSVPSCPHSERVGNRFCPVCGVPVGTKRKFYASSEMDTLVSSLPRGYACIPVSEGSTKTAIGFGVTTGYDETSKSVEIPSIEEVRAHLKAVLEPMGLWEDTAFGFHAGLSWG